MIQKTTRPLFIFAVLLLLCGCTSVPRGVDIKVADFSGAYLYMVSRTSGDPASSSRIYAAIRDMSEVVVSQDGNRSLRFTYMTRSGATRETVIDLNEGNANWVDGALVHVDAERVRNGILPGYARQTRETVISKDEFGNIVLRSSFSERGLMLYIIPFKDTFGEYTTTLIHRK